MLENVYLKKTMRFGQLTAVCLVSVLLCAGCQVTNRTLSMTDAENSYKQGDHARAFRLSEALAYEGDREAQYALGYMYFHGVGVGRDQKTGIFWIEKSAENGYEVAANAMRSIRNYGNLAPLPMHQSRLENPSSS